MLSAVTMYLKSDVLKFIGINTFMHLFTYLRHTYATYINIHKIYIQFLLKIYRHYVFMHIISS